MSVCVCVCVYCHHSDHSECGPESCGPLAECTSKPVGGCVCVSGYEIPPEHIPVNGSYGCVGELHWSLFSLVYCVLAELDLACFTLACLAYLILV